MTEKFPRQNPFLELKFYEFAAISALVLAFFPVSLLVCWLAFGTQTTRDLIGAMVKDWVQTLMIIIGLVVLLLGGSVWGLIEWLS
jgi:succinate dehydrogenase hydrophobic anchor subunit